MWAQFICSSKNDRKQKSIWNAWCAIQTILFFLELKKKKEKLMLESDRNKWKKGRKNVALRHWIRTFLSIDDCTTRWCICINISSFWCFIGRVTQHRHDNYLFEWIDELRAVCVVCLKRNAIIRMVDISVRFVAYACVHLSLCVR